jgi:hypothetical protein
MFISLATFYHFPKVDEAITIYIGIKHGCLKYILVGSFATDYHAEWVFKLANNKVPDFFITEGRADAKNHEFFVKKLSNEKLRVPLVS